MSQRKSDVVSNANGRLATRSPIELDLSSLDLTVEERQSTAGEPLRVALDLVYEDPNNPRTEFDGKELAELARDIAQHGVLQPIVTWPADARGYQIRFGAKRRRAAEIASRTTGIDTVPIILNACADLDDYAQVAENAKRSGLTPMDLARFIDKKLKGGESAADIARRLDVDKSTITHHHALLSHPAPIAKLYVAGQCTSPKHLYELRNLHRLNEAAVSQFLETGGEITRAAIRTLASVIHSAGESSIPADSPTVKRGRESLDQSNDVDSSAAEIHSILNDSAALDRSNGVVTPSTKLGPPDDEARNVSFFDDRVDAPVLRAELRGRGLTVRLHRRSPLVGSAFVLFDGETVEELVSLNELSHWQLTERI